MKRIKKCSTSIHDLIILHQRTVTNVQRLTFKLRGGGDGEGMPLIPCQRGYVQVHVLAGLEVEVLGSPDEQFHHLPGHQAG